MPYVTGDRRDVYSDALAQLEAAIDDETPDGDMNYVINRVLVCWLERRGLSYSALADVIKVLETAKLEFYRRVAAPYEDAKCGLNGDVYGELGDG